MDATVPERRVRISRIAGRYLIFDIEDVVYIRRHHGICAVLTGTMPQNPTQNLFLGLPVELHSEEAKLLVDKGVGYIADELTDHLSRLSIMDGNLRKAYLQHIKQQRRNAQQAFEEEKAKIQAKHQAKRKAAAKPNPTVTTNPEEASAIAESGPSLFDPSMSPNPAKETRPKETLPPSITPTTSAHLLPIPSNPVSTAVDPSSSSYPLYKYLNSRGYYTTPGLRFGGDYSVYPGDPFRYHAHHMANSYGWDEEIPMLDLVMSGRLGTAVKKSFLFGAEKPGKEVGGAAKEEGGHGEVRVFCIEWAGM
ncbi:uncharacterized protein B0T15DRAFT_528666 [Chaetomium strumarium]|uniref:tRNA-splicing endonuclease subunit Sen34 n=1 Tax=Chaetomium strumarium TaxID=1170767 RepID=A0AAJ0M2S0_9PEZI|nr:hypothetical protein B0T15DRAFT_528666 [Chaetomium strumarium]